MSLPNPDPDYYRAKRETESFQPSWAWMNPRNEVEDTREMLEQRRKFETSKP